jgi:hypothetical protein
MRLLAITLLVLVACHAQARIEAVDTTVSSVKVVDYHDQLELPIPGRAGLESLIGRQQADQVAPAITPNESNERPHRFLLRVEFHTSVDLQALADQNTTIFLHSYFCAHQNDFAVLSAPTVYSNGEPVRASAKNMQKTPSTTAEEHTYYFYLNVNRGDIPKSRPPELGFDLLLHPENVCFHVTASGASGLIYASSGAVIPEATMAAAFREAQLVEAPVAH